jgi:hypothetical protein
VAVSGDTAERTQVRSASVLRDVDWASWTCPLGWPVQGIWPEAADGTDINAVDRTSGAPLPPPSMPDSGAEQALVYGPVADTLAGGGGAGSGAGGAPLLATGDDFGGVKLFRYPCLSKGALCEAGVGHSSHVTNVRFSRDNAALLSVGGNDRTLIQWRLVRG